MNQLILWALFLAPWLLIIPLNTERVKRFVPVGLFSTVLITIVYQLGERYEWWVLKENLFFLTNMTPSVYGLFIVMTIIVFYFTYPSFWLYLIANIILDVLQVVILGKLLDQVNLYELKSMPAYGIFLIALLISLINYLFQKWQDTAFDHTRT
ncbi:hypothetical protein [Metabacillus iocasae]|uniref:Uncharacterized protein n=1 Tax=Priestia iocasae TaxID=2291674 RepID=A0ABS2QU76_9BACI|nr:hypothetical protein [Metabacillus iocasae]MBM7703030.1 hypothetical protein [Metabacillus iocasae]